MAEDEVVEEEARAHISLEALLRLRRRASGFSFLPRQPIHSLLAGRHASRLRGRGLDFEELRHYAEGDDTRTIDWPATARLGAPYVRVYTEERDRPVLLLVDQRLSMFFGSRRAMKSVVAAEAAALAAFRVTSLGDRVGAIVFSENGLDEIRPQRRDQATLRILHAVARQNARLSADDPRPPDPSLLNAALRAAERLVPHDGLVCLISDAFGADQDTAELVTRLTAHNDVLALFIRDPLEEELPDVGRVVVAEAGLRMEVNTSDATLRNRFAADFTTRNTLLQDMSRRRSIPVLPLSTDRDVADQLRDFLGRRLARRNTPAGTGEARP